MDLKNQLFRGFILALISAVGFGFMATLVSKHKTVAFDQHVTLWVRSTRSPILTSIMKDFTFIGSTPVVIAISLVILFSLIFFLNHRAEALLFFSVILGSSILYAVLKQIFHRQRPTIQHLVQVSGYSFPSGHSTEAFALYGVLAFIVWRHLKTRLSRSLLIVFACIMITAIGVSRIYLGVHFPSDVVAGYFASGCWLSLAVWYFQRYEEKKYEKNHIK